MSFIFNSTSTIFFDHQYLKMEEFYKKLPFYASGLKKQAGDKNFVLIDCEKKHEAILILICTLYLGKIAVLLNPKMPLSLLQSLKDELKDYFLINMLPSLDSSKAESEFCEDKPSVIVATSGSSGKPKLIAQTMKNWSCSTEGVILHLNAKSYEPWVLSLPLFHVSGLGILFRALYSSSPIIISNHLNDATGKRFSFVPSQLSKLYKNQNHEFLRKAKSLLIGGTKIPESIFEVFKDFPIHLTYGMTETCSSFSITEKSPRFVNEGTILEHRNLEISKDGKLEARGPCVAKHKVENGSLIPLFEGSGYTLSDSIEIIDDKIKVLGRDDERIEIHGEKIFPEILENIFYQTGFFEKVVITSLKTESDTFIGAFVYPQASEELKKTIKEKINSLFFPKIFLELDPDCLDQKPKLSELKNILAKSLFPMV